MRNWLMPGVALPLKVDWIAMSAMPSPV